MEKRRLTTFVVSLKNLQKRSLRTKSLIAVVAVLAFAVFCGDLLSQSLSLGGNYMSGRMGADIMVVPRGYVASFEDTLLRSRSNTFFLDEKLMLEISALPGVEKISPQIYIGALNAACCTVPVQLIGFEPETDFSIKSWMKNIDSSKLGFGEVVVGSRVNATVGEQVWFYGQPLKVLATLDDTGMGFDAAVFMTQETMQHMIDKSKEVAVHPAGTGNNRISALFIKSSGNSEASKVARTIMNAYPQTDAVVLGDMMQHISAQLGNIKGLIYGIQAAVWLISGLVLAVVFTVTTNERKREFGLYLALGATRKKLESLIITETLIISLAGGLCGVLAACFIMFDFRMLIAVSLGLPYMQPLTGSTFVLAVMSLLITVLTGVAACLYSVIRIGRSETYIMIREFG